MGILNGKQQDYLLDISLHMKVFSQIIEMIDLGLVILDKDMRVRYWNRWLESHSGFEREKICGTPILEHFPHLDNPKFKRNFKAVFAFGNFYFFSRKFYDFLFPFKPDSSFITDIDNMQQLCTMGPIRDSNNVIKFVFISVKDVTETSIYEKKLTEALFNMLDTGGSSKREPESVLTDLFSSAVDNPFALFDSTDQFKNIKDGDADETIEFKVEKSAAQTPDQAGTDETGESAATQETGVDTERKVSGLQFVRSQIDELTSIIDPATSAFLPQPKRIKNSKKASTTTTSSRKANKKKKEKAEQVEQKKTTKAKFEEKLSEIKKQEKSEKSDKIETLPQHDAKKKDKATVNQQIEGIFSIIDFAVGKPDDS